MKYGREEEELRDGGEKRGRCGTREREKREMRDEIEGRGRLVMKGREGEDGRWGERKWRLANK